MPLSLLRFREMTNWTDNIQSCELPFKLQIQVGMNLQDWNVNELENEDERENWKGVDETISRRIVVFLCHSQQIQITLYALHILGCKKICKNEIIQSVAWVPMFLHFSPFCQKCIQLWCAKLTLGNVRSYNYYRALG